MTKGHSWKFVRIGGVDQIVFRSGEDIVRIEELDQKLWMALAMPTRGVEFDPKTADFIDADHDGRIRPPEVIAAVRWAKAAFNDAGELMKGGDSVALASIKDPDILAGARRILANLKKPDAQAVTLSDVSDTVKNLAETRFNGDGVIIAESADEPDTRKAVEEIISAMGAVPDRSGKPGLNQANLDLFFSQAQTLADWAAKGEADKSLTPIGLDATTAASNAVRAVKAKVDDFFTRCRLAAFDSRAMAALNRSENDFLAIAAGDLTITAAEIATFPLAKIEPNAALPLAGDAVNPAWSAALSVLASAAVAPLIGAGGKTLTEADWTAVQVKLAAFDAWAAGKPVLPAEKTGLPRLRELIRAGAKAKIEGLIKQDSALEREYNQFSSVEKLVRFQKDLYALLINFVNFAGFYGKKGAVFQVGALYLDNRSCNLCIEVSDPGKHAALAGLAGVYLVYCDLTRPGGARRTIAAVFSNGDSDNLMMGRNGVFYDRKGQDWDATIVKVISNPISIREAFLSPYKKLIRMIEEQVAKRAASADAEADARLASTAGTVANADKAAPGKKPEPKKVDIGTVAALGVAFGAISTAIAALSTGLMKLSPWQILLVPLGIMLLISGPSMIIAWLKLRQRNLGPILDANGWAINNVAKMNIPFGASLTDLPALPPGAERSLKDPYAEKKSPWPKIILILLLLFGAYKALDKLGFIDRWINSIRGKETVQEVKPVIVPEPAALPATQPDTPPNP